MSILKEADTIIYGDREKTYGHPSRNLGVVAQMWTAYLVGSKAITTENTIGAKDVAAMMVLLKTARLANNPDHRDSLVDICGYAALIERCNEQPTKGEEA
jgi:hypothetical protein